MRATLCSVQNVHRVRGLTIEPALVVCVLCVMTMLVSHVLGRILHYLMSLPFLRESRAPPPRDGLRYYVFYSWILLLGDRAVRFTTVLC